jgi:hypothetical protein
MIRVFVEEWRCGRKFLLRRGLPVLTGVLVLGMAVLGLPPEGVFEGLGVGILLVGLASGTRFWNGDPGWDWKMVRESDPVAYAAGKFAGWLAVSLVGLLALAPILVFLVLQWDLPLPVVGGALVWVLVGGAGAQVLGQGATWGEGSLGRLVGSVLTLVWVGSTLVEPSLRPWNPLWETGQAFVPGVPGSTVLVAQIAGAVTGLWVVLVLVWKRLGGSR